MREPEIGAAPEGSGAWFFARGREIAVVALLGGLALFAYRGLLSYNPLAESRQHLEGGEAFFFSPADSDPTLIFLLTGLLLYQRRRRILRASVHAPSGRLALPLVLSASGLCAWGHFVEVHELLVPSLSLMLLGAAAWWGGKEGLRAVSVPALFLMLAYRPPGVLVNQVVYGLQLVTVDVTHGILDMLGIWSEKSGELLLTRERAFHVIESCAGLRFVATLLMASVIYVEIMGCSRLRAAILVAVSPLVGMLGNEIRVLSLVFNPYSGFASVHTFQGIVMVVAGVLAIAGLDRLLIRLLPAASPGAQEPRTPAPLSPRGSTTLVRRLVVLSLVLGALGVVNSTIPAWTPPRIRTPRLSRFPVSLQGWRAEGLPFDKKFRGGVGISEWVHRRYTKGDREVTLFLASDNRLNPRLSLISPKTALLGAGWEPVERETVTLPPDELDAEVWILRSREERALAYHWYQGVETFSREALRSLLALDRGPWRRAGRSLVLRVSTPLYLYKGERAEAEKTLNEFVVLARHAVANLKRPVL